MDYKIVWIDDEPDVIQNQVRKLREKGHTVVGMTSPLKAIDFVHRNASKIKLIICDLQMDEMHGMEVRRTLLEKHAGIPFVVVSAFITRELALSGIEHRVARFLEKPISNKELLKVIDEVTKERIHILEEEKELVQSFLEESQPLLDELDSLNLRIEEDPTDPYLYGSYMRMLHTLKGTAACVGIPLLPNFFHRFEDYVGTFKSGSSELNERAMGKFFSAIDTTKRIFKAIKEDNFFDLESASLLNLFEVEAPELKSGDENVAILESKRKLRDQGPEPSEDEKITIAVSVLDQFLEVTGKLTIIRRMIKSKIDTLKRRYIKDKDVIALTEIIEEMQKENQLLQSRSESLRKVPLSIVFKPLKRAVRDLSRTLGKKVELSVQGGDLLVDRKLTKVLNGALTHIVRNCVDHGIETPEERQSKSKKPVGQIAITAQIRDDQIRVEVTDDGRGIDIERIKKKAQEKNHFSQEELEAMEEQELANLIFAQGFSTAKDVTEVSGRGVGLEIVKESVSSLGGKVDFHSEFGKGCRFVLNIPVPKSFLVLQALYACSNGHSFAIPREEVESVVDYGSMKKSQKIRSIEGEEVFDYHGVQIALFDLRRVFAKAHDRRDVSLSDRSVVIITDGVTQCGLIVDQVLSLEEIVIKEMDEFIKLNNLFGKATLIGDEGLSPVLDFDCFSRVLRDHVKTSLRASA